MKKNILLFLVLIIVLVLGFFVIFKYLNNKNDTAKIKNIYELILEKGQYQFTTEDTNTNKIVVSNKNNKTAIDMYNKEGRTTTLVADGFTYYINHADKEYYVYEGSENQNIILDEFAKVKDMTYTKGKEKIYGKQYTYEEYNGVDSFAMNILSGTSENEVKTRFYFDSKGEIVYIKTINANEEELLKASITFDVKDDAIKIPSDYAENK